jgi:hypothetical protein
MPETLFVHNIDMHYHAGQERQPGTSLADYLEHAVMTGRVVLGVTDHLERYIGTPRSHSSNQPLYEQSVKGLHRFREDVDQLRERFSSLEIYFGPEIHAGPRIDLRKIPQGVVDIADYFFVSLPTAEESVVADTEAKTGQINSIAEMRERTGRPTFVAHPFRAAVNNRLVKRPILPWVTAITPRSPDEFSDGEINEFFGFDVRAIGKACGECNLPVEINGGTDSRIRGLNLPAPLQMFWAGFRIMKEEGTTFVPGSDQHGFMRTRERREGRYIPFDAFQILGLTARDIVFLEQLGNASV